MTDTRTVIKEKLALVGCGVLSAVVAVVILGACAVLAPVRWVIEWDAKRSGKRQNPASPDAIPPAGGGPEGSTARRA
jgi:hypothetical protein